MIGLGKRLVAVRKIRFSKVERALTVAGLGPAVLLGCAVAPEDELFEDSEALGLEGAGAADFEVGGFGVEAVEAYVALGGAFFGGPGGVA